MTGTADLDGTYWSSWLMIPRCACGCKRPWRSAIAAATSRPRSTALAQIAARDADDPWMRLAILSGLAESCPALHRRVCDAFPPSAAGPNCWRRPPRSSGFAAARPSCPSLLGMIASRLDQRPATTDRAVPIRLSDYAVRAGRGPRAVGPAASCVDHDGTAPI